ncbi:hypothetical protein EYF80_061746 [Liparis tanakae]|uniref:Uncharacterized protein n=1 Tax=Liparis tanakae TaxID=230148 RepID=A0A4Z2EGQ3_9TELE|nr:hypothetical protein EYF80_061746 [Liparis tanakae]
MSSVKASPVPCLKLSDTAQDLHPSPRSEDPVASSSRVSAGAGQQDVSLLTIVGSSISPTRLQTSSSSLASSPTGNITSPSAPSGPTNDNAPKARSKMDEPRVQSTLLHHCKMATGWQQEPEPCSAPTDLRPSTCCRAESYDHVR